MEPTSVTGKIQDLIYASLWAHNVREDDAVSLKTLKLILLDTVVIQLGLDWSTVLALFKTHTPVHPDLVNEFGAEHELAQVFIRNDRLARLLKGCENVHWLLAVDGLNGGFEPKHYLGNLRYGYKSSTALFDREPECRRLHVQTVRRLYEKVSGLPHPEKLVHETVRQCLETMTDVKLPIVNSEQEEEEELDEAVLDDLCRFYVDAMDGQAQNFVKTLKQPPALHPRRGGEKRKAQKPDEE